MWARWLCKLRWQLPRIVLCHLQEFPIHRVLAPLPDPIRLMQSLRFEC